MKGITSYRITTKMRLKEIAEAKKIDDALIKHYTFIVEQYEKIIAKHDDEIAKIEAEKAEVFKQFIEAPQLLKELNQHIAELTKTRQTVTKKDAKVKKLRHLRERYEALKHQMVLDGINIEETKKNIDALEKNEAEKAAAAKKVDDEMAVAREAAKMI